MQVEKISGLFRSVKLLNSITRRFWETGDSICWRLWWIMCL